MVISVITRKNLRDHAISSLDKRNEEGGRTVTGIAVIAVAEGKCDDLSGQVPADLPRLAAVRDDACSRGKMKRTLRRWKGALG